MCWIWLNWDLWPTTVQQIFRVVGGRVLQFARPQDLFREPTCPTVAGFIGEGHVIDAEDIHPIGQGRARVRLMGRPVEVRYAPRERYRQRGQISFHPGDLRPAARPEDAAFAARVTRTTYRGAYLRTEVQTGPLHLTMTVPAPAPPSTPDRKYA